MSFRAAGSSFLITWSQINYDGESTDFLLQTLLPLFRLLGTPSSLIVALEDHQDGGRHVHCFVCFSPRIDRRVSSQLDAFGKHPNIAPKRTRREQSAAYTYCKKDGNFVEWGDPISFDSSATSSQHSNPGSRSEPVSNLADRVSEHSTYPSWLQFCYERGVPSGYCTELWRSCRVGVETLESSDPVEGNISCDRLLGMHFDLELYRALVLVGPSGCGKTTWARRHSPRPCLFVRHVDDLRHFRAGFHLSIIFDDMCFAGDLNGRGAWPRTSQIHLVDFDVGSSIHCRYVTVYIPAGVYKVFTGNSYMFTGPDEAIDRRVTHIDLY